MKTTVMKGLTLTLHPGYENQGPMGPIKKITVHWTVGDRASCHADYHYGCTQNQQKEAFIFSSKSVKEKAAHTYQDNTSNIGFAFNAMVGATQNPWHSGPCPVTTQMIEKSACFLAELCVIHNLDPLPSNQTVVLDHYLRSKLHPQYPNGYGKWDCIPYWDTLISKVRWYYTKISSAVKNAKYIRDGQGLYNKGSLSKLGVFENLDLIYDNIAGKTSFN